MNTKTKTKPKTDLQIERQRLDRVVHQDLDAPIESNQWRVTAFITTGKSHRDQDVYPSEKACAPTIKQLRKMKSENPDGIVVSLDGTFPAREFSHAIALPAVN